MSRSSVLIIGLVLILSAYLLWILSADAPLQFWVILGVLVAAFVIVLVVQP